MARHNELGKLGELYAQNYLVNRGYEILERNYRYKHKEVDIIAKEGDEVVFVEVKTRSKYTRANDVITDKKINYLREAAEEYVREKDLSAELRFDVILLYCRGESSLALAGGKNYDVEVIKGAFR